MLLLARGLLSPKLISSKITIGYSAGTKFDGLGAQLQRVLAINALGDYWSIDVQHRPIPQIAIHPLDGITTPEDFSAFMKDINNLIDAHAFEDNSSKFMHFENFDIFALIKVVFLTLFSKAQIYVEVTHPYFFVDAMPDLYWCNRNANLSERLRRFTTLNLENQIVLHHRQGVGNMAIQPGQKIPREISQESYLSVLNACLQNSKNKNITIVTDAPLSKLNFYPPPHQLKSWVGLPAFDGVKMIIQSNSLNWLTDQLQPSSNEVTVIRGGNPLETLANMSTSQVLVLSRSSFGYAAAILARNTIVWIPDDFWHEPLTNWLKYTPI